MYPRDIVDKLLAQHNDAAPPPVDSSDTLELAEALEKCAEHLTEIVLDEEPETLLKRASALADSLQKEAKSETEVLLGAGNLSQEATAERAEQGKTTPSPISSEVELSPSGTEAKKVLTEKKASVLRKLAATGTVPESIKKTAGKFSEVLRVSEKLLEGEAAQKLLEKATPSIPAKSTQSTQAFVDALSPGAKDTAKRMLDRADESGKELAALLQALKKTATITAKKTYDTQQAVAGAPSAVSSFTKKDTIVRPDPTTLSDLSAKREFIKKTLGLDKSEQFPKSVDAAISPEFKPSGQPSSNPSPVVAEKTAADESQEQQAPSPQAPDFLSLILSAVE